PRRFGTRERNIMRADSKEFGSNNARSNSNARMSRVIRVQSPSLVGLASVQTLSMNGADVNSPATHGRTSSVISAFGKFDRTAFNAGIASTASPTQFGPRIRIFLGAITRLFTFGQPLQNQVQELLEVRNLSRDSEAHEVGKV